MAKRKQEPESKPVQFQHVTLSVSMAGHTLEYCAIDDPRATIFYVNKQGQKYSASRPVANAFAVEVRSAHRMTGACHKMLHWETWSQPLGETPKIPANALFIAKAFELAETQP